MLIRNVEKNLRVNPNTPRWKHRSRIERLILHHSETTNQTIDNINNYHIDYRGWYRISYHFVIDDTGTVFQTNQIRYYTWHAAGANATGIGICMLGNFDCSRPSDHQMKSMVELCTRLAITHGIITKNIIGHREVNHNKTCPGTKVSMDDIREKIDPWNKESGFGWLSEN